MRCIVIIGKVVQFLNRNDDKISNFELGNLIFLTILGVGIINLPSLLAKDADSDAWILVIVDGGIIATIAYIMCKIGQRHSNLGFVGTLQYLFGKILGTAMAVPVALYTLVLTAVELRLFAEVTKIYLLHKTPLEFIILPIIILTVLLVRMGIEPISRAFGIYLFIIGFAVLFIIATGYQGNDYSNLLPMFKTPIPKFISGISSVIFAFSGFELLLVVFPYVRHPMETVRVAFAAIGSITVLYVVITIYCISKLGVEETKASIWPVMALVKTIAMPGGFIQNLEGILSSLWVVFAFTSLVGILYFFSVVAQGIFKHQTNKQFVSLSIPIMYLLSLQGESVPEVMELSDRVIKYMATYTILILPVLMLVFSYIKGKKIN
jgi:spore germination protein